MNGKSLKEQNKANLILFLAWNVIVLLFVLSFPLYMSDGEEIAKKVLSENGLFMIFSPIILIVLNGLLNSRLKVMVVFWKWRNGLPAHRAFTKYMYSDTRINIEGLKLKHGELPTDPILQNNLWYSISLKLKDEIIITDSHKSYLLSRDMTAISFVFLLVIAIVFLSDIDFKVKVLSSFYYVIQYIVIMIVARNYGKRFTCNVLAIESQT